MFQKVLVPLDGSEYSEGILPYVSEMARSLDSSLILLSVLNPNSVEAPKQLVPGDPLIDVAGDARMGFKVIDAQPVPGDNPAAYATQLEQLAEEQAEARWRDVLDRLAEEGVKARAMATFGPPAEEIVRVAEAESCDLIALSTRGGNRLGRLLTGSVTGKVVNLSPIPALTINHELAQQVESDPRRNTAGRAAAAAAVAAKTSQPLERAEPVAQEGGNGPRLSDEKVRSHLEILLVEDNPGDVRLTQEALEDSHVPHNLTVAEDGEQAIAILRNPDAPRPDVILLDLGLPKMSGHELLAEIKGDPDLKLISVVVLTASRSEEDILRSYSLQANNYMAKPLQPEHLIVAIDAVQDYLGAIARLQSS